MLNHTEPTECPPKDLAAAIVRNPITVSPEMTFREAIGLMSEVRSACETNSAADLTARSASNPVQTEVRASCVVVVEDQRVVGIFTERDVVRLCAQRQGLDETPVSQVMTASVRTLRESGLTDFFAVMNLLQQNHIRHLPILDEQDGLVGLVTCETLWQVSPQSLIASELQDRQRVETQLRQSTERLQQAQCIAHLGNWELDHQHHTLLWSEEIFRIFEIDPQQFGASYEAFLDLVYPDDRVTLDAAYTRHLDDRQPYDLVHRLQVPDGRIKYVHEQCETTYSPDGVPLISRGTVQDITQQKEAEIRRDRAEASLRQVIEGTATFTGAAFFPALVRHVSEALRVRYVSVSQATPDGFQVLAFFADGELCPPPFLPYESVPCCSQALKTGNCCHPADIQALYPGNALFTDLRVDSYLGVGLRNAAGDPIGNLCILHDAPLADPGWAQTLLSIFAARAGAELERLLTAQALELLNAELEERVIQRTAELAEREALLQDFLDNANDLIQIVDLDTRRFKFVNRTWRQVLGYTAAEVEQLNCFDVLTPDCQAHCQAILDQMRSGCFTHTDQVELTFVGKSGQRVVVEGNINCRFATEADGSPQAISTRGIFRDVTVKKTAEQALKRREVRYRGLMEGAADAILLADLQGNIIEANQKAESLLGYALAELTTLHFTQLHSAEEFDRVTRSFAETVQRQRTSILDVACQRQDGTAVFVDITATVIDIEGEILVQEILRDITDRKAAEMLICQQADREILLREITQRIRQSLDLQTIFDTACQEIRLVVQADRVGIFKFYPDSNWDDGEFVAESVVEGFVSAMAIRIHDHCFGDKYAPLYLQGRYAAMEDIYQLESQCHTDVLAQFQVRANLIMPLLNGDNLWGLLCIHQCSGTRQWQPFEIDVTQQLASQLAIAIQQANLFEQLQQELIERKQAQTQLTERNQQLAVTNQELARATRLKDEFLANMSHELRTPLNAILGMTEGLQDEVFGIVNERQLKALHTLESSAAHLLSLINDILDVAKIESGQVKLEYGYVAIEQLCSSSLAFVKQQALKKCIQLHTQIPPHLPDLFVDEIRMRQVLLNLLTNAVKFTPEGGTVTLTVSCLSPAKDAPQPSTLRFTIMDTGIGIAPENLSKLFKPFVQIDGALNRQQTGTGLGLALVKQIVELHGGQVVLTSEPGMGSCFMVDLPYTAQAFPTPTDRLSIDHEPDLAAFNAVDLAPVQAPLVLLAEDNPANVATISSYLEAKGYRVVFANNGQEAVDLAMTHHPDVILMDIQMPGMDGIEAMQQIRRQESLRETPIIALTALAMQGDRERCLAAGANHYLSKPVKLKQLDFSVKGLLADRSLE